MLKYRVCMVLFIAYFIEKKFMRLTLGPMIGCLMILPVWLASLAMAGGSTPRIDAPLMWSQSKV